MNERSSPGIEQPWRYEIQHGPDGETDYAWVYDENNNLVCTTKTHYAIAIVDASLETPFCVKCGSAEGCDAVAATTPDRDETLRGLAEFFSESVHLVWSNDEIADCLTGMIGDAAQAATPCDLSVLIKQYAIDLRRNASGSDDYPYDFAKGVADYLKILIKRAKGNCSCAQAGFPDSCDNCDAAARATMIPIPQDPNTIAQTAAVIINRLMKENAELRDAAQPLKEPREPGSPFTASEKASLYAAQASSGLIHPGMLMNVIQAKINDYLELQSRGDLTECGDHAWLVLVNLQRDMEFALKTSSEAGK